MAQETAHQRDQIKRQINDGLELLAEEKLNGKTIPTIFLLQEIARHGDTSDTAQDLVQPPKHYRYLPIVSIDTKNQPHPIKWDRYENLSQNYKAQGYAILWPENINHSALWDFDDGHLGASLETEVVRLDTGVYTGSRDTEPRLVVVAHFVLPVNNTKLDLFVVNLHLTTLQGERDGYPERDDRGTELRLSQLDVVLNGIVTRCNRWARANAPQRRPVWIIGGDFNCTPDSSVIRKIERLNFVDLNPNKGTGTKRPGNSGNPELSLDYLFAGVKYYSFDPANIESTILDNPSPRADIAGSDHCPVVAYFPLS